MTESITRNDTPAVCHHKKERGNSIVGTVKGAIATKESLQAPTLPVEFENLPAFRRACESIRYNFSSFEYNYFPKGQLRKIAIFFTTIFLIIGTALLGLFAITRTIQHILGPLPALFGKGILVLVLAIVFFMVLRNFFKIIKFIPAMISKIALKK